MLKFIHYVISAAILCSHLRNKIDINTTVAHYESENYSELGQTCSKSLRVVILYFKLSVFFNGTFAFNFLVHFDIESI